MAGIRLVAQLHVAEGTSEEFADAWRDHLAEVASEPGCLQYEMFRSSSDPDQIALLEHWASRDAFETHWALELSQPGGPGVPAVDHLLVEWNGAMFHTEIYNRKRSVFADGEWTVDPD
jgi:quinol monooxygenase YgiN